MKDSLDALLDDVRRVFCGSKDKACRERSREHIECRGLALGAGETAMHACVGDMAARALALGAEGSPAADRVSVAASYGIVPSALGMPVSAERPLE